MLPPGLRAFWPGTNATVPAGWSRDTAFDNLFALQGDGATFTGPLDTADILHLHDADPHEHTGSRHRHRVTGAAATGGTPSNIVTSGVPTIAFPGVTLQHTHPRTFGAEAGITYTTGGFVTLTPEPAARPPSATVIVIRPDNTMQDIPNGAVAFADSPELPIGFAAYPTWHHKFLIGAATGDDAGDLIGSETHTHTSNPGHVHSALGHSHPAFPTAPGTKREVDPTLPAASYINQAHHSIALTTAPGGLSGDAFPDAGPASSLPEFVTLKVVRNTSGIATTPTSIVVPYVDDIATLGVPQGWVIMDGTGQSNVDCTSPQIRCTVTDTEIGDTGGQATHSHVIDAHFHAGIVSHFHGSTQINNGNQFIARPGFVPLARDDTHDHVWTISATAPGNTDPTSPGSSDEDARRAYRTVVFLKKIQIASIMPTAPLWRRRRKRRTGSPVLQKA